MPTSTTPSLFDCVAPSRPPHPFTGKENEALAQVLPQLSQEAVAKLAASARLVTHPAQVTLCEEGRIEDCFYIIVEGTVDVFKVMEGQRLFINQLTAGAQFGEIALLLDIPRTATIVTSTVTRVFEIDRGVLAELLKTSPELIIALAQLVVKRFLAQEEKRLMEISRLRKGGLPSARVFLSYSRSDVGFATRLAESVLKHQIDVWFDVYRLEPGISWARQIGEALDRCELMLLVLSPECVASQNVEDEWNYYLDQKKPVVTVMLQPCKIPYRLSKLHYVNFHETDFDLAAARVIATLNTQLSAATPPASPIPAKTESSVASADSPAAAYEGPLQ